MERPGGERAMFRILDGAKILALQTGPLVLSRVH
jgi:hypothetical protein